MEQTKKLNMTAMSDKTNSNTTAKIAEVSLPGSMTRQAVSFSKI